MKQLLLLIALFLMWLGASAQPAYTANDYMPPYQQASYFGTNLGWYGSAWPDAKLADVAMGNPAIGVAGVGVRNLRIVLPEHHLERWGYSVEATDLAHYASLGARELTALLQGPSAAHRDEEQFCPQESTQLFANLYTPIWDDGADGTPINEENYYARYVYLTVQAYKDYVRFWEIMNEPDYTPSDFGWRPAGMAGSWYDAPPDPCDLPNLRAPIYYYIRMLRIAYEVVKTVAPESYVAVGGLGYPSFLDAILRYSDKPDDGAISAAHPYTGGAYFDVLSYHSYPANDGSLRYWDTNSRTWVHTRHSDAAVQGLIRLKNDFNQVLQHYNYGGAYPAKRWIVTESNISRAPFNEQMGSEAGQRNYLIKAMALSRAHGIDQFYTFMLSDRTTPTEAASSWDLMGLYYALADVPPYQQLLSPGGVAFKTAADLLHEYQYDNDLSTQLALPEDVEGAAYANAAGEPLFVLWAKTTTDRSEAATASYTFPPAWGIQYLEKRTWNYSLTGHSEVIAATAIALNGDPVFLLPKELNTATQQGLDLTNLSLSPNPARSRVQLSFHLAGAAVLQADLYDAKGQWVQAAWPTQRLAAGTHKKILSVATLPAGYYQLCLRSAEGLRRLSFLILK